MKVIDWILDFLPLLIEKGSILGEIDPEVKEDIPESPIRRIVLPFNTVNNKNILQ